MKILESEGLSFSKLVEGNLKQGTFGKVYWSVQFFAIVQFLPHPFVGSGTCPKSHLANVNGLLAQHLVPALACVRAMGICPSCLSFAFPRLV